MNPPTIPEFQFAYHSGETMRRLYATDASEYQEMPHAVAFPENDDDITVLIRHARAEGLSLIPRTAGTSLAGQVVGPGIVVDCGRHMNRILEIDVKRRRVRVQPGVVRDELNHKLAPHGLLFGPETSTANRAMIGGMIGNNSCGSNSVVFGSTRDHLISCQGRLSDGTEAVFGPLGPEEFEEKCALDSLEGSIYRSCRELLGNSNNRRLIREAFPKASIPRRNTGYALDLLMDSQVFDPDSSLPFNLCRLIAGSEGTLFFGTEFELECDPLPPPHSALLCVHFSSVIESLQAVSIALSHQPSAVELIDRHILEATKRNREQQHNRFFVKGDPGAILVIDIRRDSSEQTDSTLEALEADLRSAGLGTHYPILKGRDEAKVWELRRAGQGLMSNVPGDAKPREVVEDTAVDVRDLPAYIAEFDSLLREKHGIECVYYAHAGSGELHTRPLFNLKTPEGLRLFRDVATDIAALVKKYRGSLSGEHGDGRLRGEFIPQMVGDECYVLMKRIKAAFDPENIFNPGKIIDTPPMDTSLRYGNEIPNPDYETIFDFSENLGLLRAAEQCNGSGDCRKGVLAGGVMCPSYMATRNEKDSTRARANILRQMLTRPSNPEAPFDSPAVHEVLDLCLSCKGCKAECPSSVDITKMKAEFLQQYYDLHGVPLRSRMIAEFTRMARLASRFHWAWNTCFGTRPVRRFLNRMVGFHPDRTIPRMAPVSFGKWHRRRTTSHPSSAPVVYLFVDEFSEYQDVTVAQSAIELLEALGYEVRIPDHLESARTWLSKGLVRKAREIAMENVRRLAPLISSERPLVGIEPSGILGFRDEYIDLMPPSQRESARELAVNCLMFEEFIVRELEAGRISPASFTSDRQTIALHGHCFQKSLASVTPSIRALELPANYHVQVIPSGCCGMAGSFGYEKEHFDLSMNIGELVLFPQVRSLSEEVLIAAPGTSCRHQIHDGTGRRALHPAQILHQALIRNDS